RGEGRAVTALEAQARVMARVTGEQVSAFFADMHRQRGVDIRLGVQLAAIEKETNGLLLRASNGEDTLVDVALVATGARANDELARSAGLACDDGILVDEFAAASAPGVYAVGDCARFPSRRYGRRLRLECVQNAIDQAKAAAAAMLGKPQAYDPVPWFWSDQYELKLQMAGLSDGYDEATTVGDVASARFSVEYRKAGKLI